MENLLNSLSRWMVVLALMVAYSPFERHAQALNQTLPAAASAKAPFLYAANFEWNGAVYRFAVQTRSQLGSESSRFVAEISRDGQLWANCERQIPSDTLMDTNSLLLRCEGRMFAPAAATVRFVFGPTMNEPHLKIWTSARAIGKDIALNTWVNPETPSSTTQPALAKTE